MAKICRQERGVGKASRRGHDEDTGQVVVTRDCMWVLTVPLAGQTVERDTTITGPRGRSIERQVEIQRTPGSIERQVQIKRPGGNVRPASASSAVAGWRPEEGTADRGAVAPTALDTAHGRDRSAGTCLWVRIDGCPDVEFLVRRRWWWRWNGDTAGAVQAAVGWAPADLPGRARHRPLTRSL